MTLNKLASIVAKREGKKSQAAIGNIREILKILVRLQHDYWFGLGAPEMDEAPSMFFTYQGNKLEAKKKKRKKVK